MRFLARHDGVGEKVTLPLLRKSSGHPHAGRGPAPGGGDAVPVPRWGGVALALPRLLFPPLVWHARRTGKLPRAREACHARIVSLL
jgi:hypothetical protein